MNYNHLKHSRVFEIFEEICSIPHGSGNCKKLTDYCIDFAKKLGLKYHSDTAGNVVIYKDGTKDTKPIILQGHIDMVCQKVEGNTINFDTDGLSLLYIGCASTLLFLFLCFIILGEYSPCFLYIFII